MVALITIGLVALLVSVKKGYVTVEVIDKKSEVTVEDENKDCSEDSRGEVSNYST